MDMISLLEEHIFEVQKSQIKDLLLLYPKTKTPEKATVCQECYKLWKEIPLSKIVAVSERDEGSRISSNDSN